MASIVKRAAARRDLVEIFVWYVEEGGLDLGRRFLRSAERAFLDLVRMPRVAPLKIYEGKYAGARMWHVPGFESVLIFYRPHRDGIAIERVINAKRDYRRVLT